MKVTINFTYQHSSHSPEVTIPDSCPTCGRFIDFPAVGKQVYSQQIDKVQSVFQCTFKECLSYMICYHKPPSWELDHVEPLMLSKMSLPEFVKEISANFILIHREAEEAEARGLTEIAGPGYRKAFEFLIKDYAKQKADPTESSNIESYSRVLSSTPTLTILAFKPSLKEPYGLEMTKPIILENGKTKILLI